MTIFRHDDDRPSRRAQDAARGPVQILHPPYGLPGAGNFAAASSITSTQSLAEGGVKFFFPRVTKLPIKNPYFAST